MMYILCDLLFILGLNVMLIGIILIVIVKICFKDVGFGSYNKRWYILEEMFLKKFGDIDDD